MYWFTLYELYVVWHHIIAHVCITSEYKMKRRVPMRTEKYRPPDKEIDRAKWKLIRLINTGDMSGKPG